NDELLRPDFVARDGAAVAPRVGGGKDKHQFIAKNGAHLEAVGIFRRDGEGEIHFVVAQQFDGARSVAGFDAEFDGVVVLFQLANDFGQNVLAGGGGGGDAQAGAAPFAEAFDGLGGGIERAERGLN